MIPLLLTLILVRPFISSLAFPLLNCIYSILLLGCLILWAMSTRKQARATKLIENPLLFFILALFISLSFSQDIITSFTELYKYATAFLLLLLGLSLTSSEKDKAVLCFIISAILISTLALYQYFYGFAHLAGYITREKITNPFVLDYLGQKRIFFPFITPNILGGYLAMIIPLALVYKQRTWIIAVLFPALLLTKSIGALLSILFASSVYFVFRGKPEKKKVFFLFGMLITIGLLLLLRGPSQKQHLQPFFSAAMRLDYWQGALTIIRKYLWTGVGLGNFNLTYSRYAHNAYLQIWAEMGIIGLASFFWLILNSFKAGLVKIKNNSLSTQDITLIACCSAFLFDNLLSFSFFLPEVSLIFWFLIGMLISLTQAESKI